MSSQCESLLMGNNLLSFGASVSASLRSDIMDCLLYAQLSADKKYDRSRHWKPWIEQYQRVIYQKGGALSGAINPVQLTIQHLRELRYVPRQIAGSATSRELQVLLERSMQTLMEGDHARTFFSSWFASGSSETMQVIPCEASIDGGVNILVCGLQMTTRMTPGFFFWDALSGEMTVRSNGASFLLTEESYGPYRRPIADYLARQAQQAIIEL